MKHLACILFLLVTITLTSCKEDDSFNDKGLILLNPTRNELTSTTYNPGDTLSLQMMYSCSSPVLYLNLICSGNHEFQPGFKEPYTLFDTLSYPVETNSPLNFWWVLPNTWNSFEGFETTDRQLKIKGVLENHILNYSIDLM